MNGLLVRLEELSKRIEALTYPESYTNDKNNLLRLSADIYNHKNEQIKCMKKNNFDCSLVENEKFTNSINELFDYYNLMIKEYNYKY